MSDLVGNPNCWFSHTKAQISNISVCNSKSCLTRLESRETGFLNTDSFFIRVSSPSIVSSDCLNCYHPVDKLPWSRV